MSALLQVFVQVVLPVFGIAAVGWLYAGSRKIDEKSLAAIVIQISAPALVFHGLASKPIEAALLWRVGVGAIFASLVCGLCAFVAFRAAGYRKRGLLTAAMFPNTGNLGLPLAALAFGDEGLRIAVVVFVAISVLHYSLGVMIVSGRANPLPVLRSPLVLGAALGLLCSLRAWELPKPLLDFAKLLGDATIPLMLLGLGIRLRSVRAGALGLPLLAVSLRMLPGLGAGWLWAELSGANGLERQVLLLTGVLPPAVINFVFAEAHDQDPEKVATAILLGTLAAVFVIPAVIG